MRSVRRSVLTLVALALWAVACTAGSSQGRLPLGPTAGGSPSGSRSGGKPNVLVLLSDDQATGLFNRQLMPNVFSRIVDRGVNFTRGYVNDSQCCPSRVSILTSLGAHNSGVDSNSVR